MPWTCSRCLGQSDLGYNIYRTCQTPRPGTEPDLARRPIQRSVRAVPPQVSLGRLLACVGCIACTLAYSAIAGPLFIGVAPNAAFRPLEFSAGLGLFLGAAVGTIWPGVTGCLRGAIAGMLVGYMFPLVVGTLYLLYLVAIGEDWFPGVAD